MNQHYELLFISSTPEKSKDQEGVLNSVLGIVTKDGGSVTKKDDWGRRRLAYEINHQAYGSYYLIEFDSESEALKKIRKDLLLLPEVIRFLIVRKKVKSEKQIEEEQRIKEKIQERKVREAHVAAVEKQVPAATEAKKTEAVKGEKVSLEELDKKLDEILKEDI